MEEEMEDGVEEDGKIFRDGKWRLFRYFYIHECHISLHILLRISLGISLGIFTYFTLLSFYIFIISHLMFFTLTFKFTFFTFSNFSHFIFFTFHVFHISHFSHFTFFTFHIFHISHFTFRIFIFTFFQFFRPITELEPVKFLCAKMLKRETCIFVHFMSFFLQKQALFFILS